MSLIEICCTFCVDAACSLAAADTTTFEAAASSLPDGDDSPMRSDVDIEMSPSSSAASSSDVSALTLRDDSKLGRAAERAGEGRK